MWKGYEDALAAYSNIMILEWIRRGYNNTMKLIANKTLYNTEMPPWLGKRRFHASHQSNLLRKDPAHYSQFGWKVPDDLPYYWPSKEE